MATQLRSIRRFILDESGPTAVEYAVMLALIIFVAIAGISLFGSETFNLWTDNANQIETATN